MKHGVHGQTIYIVPEHGLVVVVNMNDMVPCLPGVDRACPHRGWFQHNTQAVFDESGFLVPRAHPLSTPRTRPRPPLPRPLPR